MNQIAANGPLNGPLNGAEAFLHRFRGLVDRLPGDEAPRREAAAFFERQGLPTTRLEDWHYTSLRSLGEAAYQEPLTAVSTAPSLGALPELPRLVLVDGRYQPGLSTPPEGVTLSTFAEQPGFAETGERLPMVAMNAMLAEDGVQITVAEGVDAGTLVLLSVAPDGHRPVDFHPRHRIALGRGARLALIEINRGEGSYLHNAVFEIDVAAEAELQHVRLQDEAAESVHVSTGIVAIADHATYDFFVLALGSRLARTEVHASLNGPHATVHLNGAQLLGGTQHADITTVVRHAAPHCASNQTVKNVLNDRSRGVFQGRIEVDRIAQKTDGYQMSQALLLSPHAEIDCKPQLEIFADDVKCSHGTTVGELDADQMFYLRSRGVPQAEARAILVRSFLHAAMDNVKDVAARALLEAAIESWWERRAS